MRRLAQRGAAVVSVALLLTALTGAEAQGKVVFLHGKAYGEMLTPRARVATEAQGVLQGRGVRSPRRVPGAPGAFPFTVGGPQPPVVYHGGPLMLSSKLYLIFWGPAGSFQSSYTTPIVQYAHDLQSDQALTTDELSVAEQYTNGEAEHISGKVTFGDDVFDTTPYPALETSEGCTKALEPCVTDKQIQTEILAQIEANSGWQTDPASAPEAQYLVYTPEGVTTCDGIYKGLHECSTNVYCAYHSQITKIGPSERVATYSDLPYVHECDSEQAPSGVSGNADADGTLDSEIHELVESATDPSESTGYTDSNEYEVADKCVETETGLLSPTETYGAPLGGNLSAFTAFNQLIGSHSYYTQQIWSNAPTKTPAGSTEPAGCVARIGPTPAFTAPASAQTGVPVNFNAGGSYDVSAPITGYAWDYGDGSPVDTTSGATASHTYTQPGTYQVSLTVTDGSGSADASTQTVPITVALTPAPTASIGSPADNQTYTLNQTVATSFTCVEGTGGPGIKSCTDSNGSTSPGVLDTTTVGPHSYTVTGASDDGQTGTATIEYTVTAANGSPGSGTPGGNPASGTGTSGSGSGTGSSGSAGSSSGSSQGAPGAPPPGGKTASLTRAQKLTKAIAACQKLKKPKRAACVAAAKKRYAPPKTRHGKTRPKSVKP